MIAAARLLLWIWHFILPPLRCLNCGKDVRADRDDEYCSDECQRHFKINDGPAV
jgi:predicted nucleic acid-binding Zn ribbon protein